MKALLFVRITSSLGEGELKRRMLQRQGMFREVPGLLQKHFGYDPQSGDICGVYLFENREALQAYRDSDLARSIPEAYEATAVRREVFDMVASCIPGALLD